MKELSNAFYPSEQIYPFYVSIKKINDKFYYKVTKYSLIFDSLADKWITSITNTGNSIEIELKSESYIYLECTAADPLFTIQISKIIHSEKLLPLVEGKGGTSLCRKLIAIIDKNGIISQSIYYALYSQLGILNGAPILFLGRQPVTDFCTENL